MRTNKCFIVLCMTDITEADTQRDKSICHQKSFKLTSTAGRGLVDVYHNKRLAETEAGRLASLEPTKLFTVLESVSFYETTTPKVIEKAFNDAGEFVLKEAK